MITAYLLSLTMRAGRRYQDWRWRQIARYVRRRAGHRCQWCGRKTVLHVHHLRPVALGGSHSPANLVAICPGCHEHAHGRDLNHDGVTGRQLRRGVIA